MNDFVTIISNLGFPIAITFYLLTRFEKKLDNLTDNIENLEKTINQLTLELKIRRNGNGNNKKE